jgi:hypothetical protein
MVIPNKYHKNPKVYKCKNCIKMKNVNVHHYLFLSETYEPVVRGICPLSLPLPPSFWQNFKKLDF